MPTNLFNEVENCQFSVGVVGKQKKCNENFTTANETPFSVLNDQRYYETPVFIVKPAVPQTFVTTSNAVA